MPGYRDPEIEDLPQLVDLCLMQYRIQAHDNAAFPTRAEMRPIIEDAMEHLITYGTGLVMFEEEDIDEVYGFMIGYRTGPLFGKDLGMHIPVYGFAMMDYDSVDFIEMYKRVSLMFVHENVYSHAISLFPVYKEMIDDLFNLGFGKRCVDAMTKVKKLPAKNLDIEVTEVFLEQLHELRDLHYKHNIFYRQTPLYMPNKDEDALKDLTTWIQKENHHIFVAKLLDQVVGYMRIEPRGESVISFHPSIMNITGAFVDPFYRHMHIGHELMRGVMTWLKDHEYVSLGVDYESINPYANAFWKKYFKPYTFTLTRRIDERIAEFTDDDLMYALEQIDSTSH